MPILAEHDPHKILGDMEQNGSYVGDKHIVYKDGTHGDKYLDKDKHLSQPGVAEKICALFATDITPGTIIISPETRSKVNLGERIAQMTGATCLSTQKILDVHSFHPEDLTGIPEGSLLIGIDDIFNNGKTYEEIENALKKFGLNLHQFRVMVNRNPNKSTEIQVPVQSLAAVQMNQWDENIVPNWLKLEPITTQLGKARNWTPKSPGDTIALKFFMERIQKEQLGFIFDDGAEVKQMDQDGYFFQPRKGR